MVAVPHGQPYSLWAMLCQATPWAVRSCVTEAPNPSPILQPGGVRCDSAGVGGPQQGPIVTQTAGSGHLPQPPGLAAGTKAGRGGEGPMGGSVLARPAQTLRVGMSDPPSPLTTCLPT